jgi:hypothetical protein
VICALAARQPGLGDAAAVARLARPNGRPTRNAPWGNQQENKRADARPAPSAENKKRQLMVEGRKKKFLGIF